MTALAGGEHAATAASEASHVLVDAVRALAGARSVDDIVAVVRTAARELVAADGATFVLRDEDQCHYVDEDAIEPLWRGLKFPLTACISGWAMLHHEAVHIVDIYADSRIPHEAYRPTFVKSLAMTPVRVDDPFAAIGVYWSDHHRTTVEEAALLQALADSTAVAFANVRTVEDLERRVAERTAALEASNRDLSAFAHVAAHDLKGPLTSVLGYAELTLASADQLGAEGVESLEMIVRAGRRMATLVDDLLAFASAVEIDHDLGATDGAELVGAVLEELAPAVTASGARIHVGALPVLTGVRPLLHQVLANLVVNALRHGAQDEPEVWIAGETWDLVTTVTVSDNGAGVPLADRDRIFTMFTRGSAAHATGHGIGLAFARRVVERHNGTITVGDAPGGGARFTISLPRPGAAPAFTV